MSQLNFFPRPSPKDFQAAFIGKSLHEVPIPSAILDISKLKHNCKLMLGAVKALNLDFRAHVKTHKTSELTKLQVGEDCKDVRLIVSTVIELESLVPLLKEYQSNGATVNVLYGIPLGASKVPRLAAVARELGHGTVSAMIDNVAQLESVRQFKQEAGTPVSVFIKADSGYHRAGLPPKSESMVELVKAVADAEMHDDLAFLGFYSHNSLSYNGHSPDDAMAMLKVDIDACVQAAAQLPTSQHRKTPLVISVGASPTALSIQNLLPRTSTSTPSSTAVSQLLDTLSLPSSFALEIHAGVYPVLDLQQTAAKSRDFSSALAAHNAQALSILAEVVSVYPDRTETPEALISSGTLALGREPCQGYGGWGVLTAWRLGGAGYGEEESVDPKRRVVVKRISQEHGVIGWEDTERKEELPVRVGDRVRLWVNHACIASAGFGWYLVVDGESDSDVVQDVWVRWRGW